jgi:sodium/potassium/calcium exchanger 2
MLVSVVIIIAVCGWRMTKGLGFSMVVLYGLFLTLAVLNSRGVIGGID